jgi:membrane protein implicated in regulation of membrane protease activity
MLLVGAILLAAFYLSPGWDIAVIAGAFAIEVVETIFWIRLSQRWRVRAGPETLIGARGVATTDLAPEGQVRVQGELWQARMKGGARAGDSVRVLAREGLLLVVERDAARPP